MRFVLLERIEQSAREPGSLVRATGIQKELVKRLPPGTTYCIEQE